MTAKLYSTVGLFALLLVGTPAIGAASTPGTRSTARAPIDQATAREIAQRHVPNSAFEHAELEKDHGKKIWSIDLRPNGSNDIVEIHLDAYTGELLGTATETPAQQRAERDEHAAGKELP